MGGIGDFIMGRSNKLLRDMLAMSLGVAFMCVGVMAVVNAAVDGLKSARQPLPGRVLASQPSPGQIITVTRSVLDDPILTGSISGRPIVLDPCTGKEKK